MYFYVRIIFILILLLIIKIIILNIINNKTRNEFIKNKRDSINTKQLSNMRHNYMLGNNLKIAFFSYNFGNYRNELSNNINNFLPISGIDYYFFTDNKKFKSNKWKIVYVDLIPRTKHMNTFRVTTKYYKFYHIPDELKKYDYVIHIDSNRIHYLNKYNYMELLDIILKNKKSFIGKIHPFLDSIYSEINHLIKNSNRENLNYLSQWKNKLVNENFIQKTNHLELCFFMRNLKDETLTKIFKEVYTELMKNNLCRDQLVFLYVLQKNNFIDIDYLFLD